MTVLENKIPEYIDDILSAEYQRVLVEKLRIHYQFSFDEKRSIQDALENIYYGKLGLHDLVGFLQKNIISVKIDINKLAMDIAGMCILPAEEYLKGQGQDVTAYIVSLGGNPSTYQKYVDTMKRAIEEEKAGTYDHDSYMNEDQKIAPAPSVIDEEERESVSIADLMPDERAAALKDFLENNLALILAPSSAATLNDINTALILTLGSNQENREDIIKIITNSKQLIGSKMIIDEGREVPQTGAAWLKDFNKIIGANHFEALMIARFLIESPSAKRLPEEEKQLLRNYLTLYHNIIAFPEPFLNLPVERWHVIPTVTEAIEKEAFKDYEEVPRQQKPASFVQKQTAKPITSPKATVPSRIESVVRTQKSVVPTMPDPQAIVEDSSELMNLKNMLLQYPSGSLERQAIEEEIKKLNN